MSDGMDYGKRVGRVDSLPPLDIFGKPRQSGWSTLGIGDGYVVAVPPGTPRAQVEAAIAPIQAWLAAQVKTEKAIHKGKATSDDVPAEEIVPDADA